MTDYNIVLEYWELPANIVMTKLIAYSTRNDIYCLLVIFIYSVILVPMYICFFNLPVTQQCTRRRAKNYFKPET